jgi:hypothetical protein
MLNLLGRQGAVHGPEKQDGNEEKKRMTWHRPER